MIFLQFAFFNTPILHSRGSEKTNKVARKRKKTKKKNPPGTPRKIAAEIQVGWKGFFSCQFSFCVTINLSRLICSCSNCMKSSHPFFFTRVKLIRAEDMQMNILCFFFFFFFPFFLTSTIVIDIWRVHSDDLCCSIGKFSEDEQV